MTGEDQFRKALQEYIRRWQRKHPVPWDFFNTFNEALGENLNWFWKPWFFSISYPDLALKNPETVHDSLRITVVNKTGLPLPVYLKVTHTDNTVQTISGPMRIWKEGAKEAVFSFPAGKAVEKIELGNDHIPDINPEDNVLYPGKVK